MKKFVFLLFFMFFGSAQAGTLMKYDGAALPPFSLNDMQGHKHALTDYHGKVVLVNFWATYCGPCIKEMPSMQRLKDQLKDKPFAILAIDMAEEKSAVDAFIKQHNIRIDFPILLNPEGDVVEQWMISAVPTTFILDPKGTIRYALFGGIEWDNPEVVKTITGLFE